MIHFSKRKLCRLILIGITIISTPFLIGELFSIDYKLSKKFIDEIPIYENSTSWMVSNNPASFPDTPRVNHIFFSYTGSYLDVYSTYEKYLTSRGWKKIKSVDGSNREKWTYNSMTTFFDHETYVKDRFLLGEKKLHLVNYNGYSQSGENYRNDFSISF